MKVNILGKGIIPGIGTLAPKYDVELSENEVKRLLNYSQFRLGDVATGLLITKANVDTFFKPSMVTELPKVKPIEVPKKVDEKKIQKTVEKKEEPVVVEEPVKEVYENPVIEIEEVSPIEITPPETVVEVTAVSERIGNVEDIIPETTSDEPISVEVVNEEAEETHTFSKKRKRRRN